MFSDFLNKNSSDSPTGSREIVEMQFEDEIVRKKEIMSSWFEHVQALKLQKAKILKDKEFSVYSPLFASLEKAFQSYENERKQNPELELPDISEESLRAMLLLFPFLYGKDLSFFMDSDLSCATVVIRPNKNERITIATKNSTLLFLSKVGEYEGFQLPFSLSLTLKLSSPRYLQKLEEIISLR